MTGSPFRDLDASLLDAVRAAARRGGPHFLTITGMDGLVFSGNVSLTAVAESLLSAVKLHELPAAATASRSAGADDPDALRKIDEAVKALTALA